MCMVKSSDDNKMGIKREGLQDINSVTKLPALRQVIEWFGNAQSSERNNDYVSVSVYKLTQYMYILENFGIEAVDDEITMLAEMLQSVFGEKGYIGHISDEWFVVILFYDSTISKDEILNLLETDNKALLDEIEKRNNIGNSTYFLEVDYGHITEEPLWQGSFENFLRQVNSEMLLNRLQKDLSHTKSSQIVLWKHQDVFNLLLEKNLFHYHFQPIVNAQNGKIFGYEALMRTDPVINMKPLEVLDIAKNLDRLYDIERITMNNVMNYLYKNHTKFEDKKMFINSIPAYMLSSQDWEILVDKYGIMMNKMVVEMTEQTEMADEELNKFRNRLKEHDISLAIDDYGTGYSNLANLIRYSPDYVKIDRSLVQNIHEKSKIQKLVAGIIEFIHENGYSALAEGVETRDELKTMIGLGVDYIQGYYLARPAECLLEEIDIKFQDEIKLFNIMCSEDIVKVYSPAENEIVNLSQLATKRYNCILIDKENVVIEGVEDTTISCSITVKDGINSNITLRNVNITTKKENPLIDIGKESNVVINLEGVNRIINRGIRVPQSSELNMSGDGSLHIHSEMVNSFAIGGDKESTYGNINIENVQSLVIDINGENCVGIGGGKNLKDSRIKISESGIKLECAGGKCVGIGNFEGNCNIKIQNCDMEFKMSCADAVGFGSLEGNTEVVLDNCSLNITEWGNNLCGIGVLSKGDGRVVVSKGTIACDIRGRNIVCFGTDHGALDCFVEDSNTSFYCEGNSVVGIGDVDGMGNVNIHDAELSMTIMAKDILDIGCKNGHLEMVDTKRNVKMNE